MQTICFLSHKIAYCRVLSAEAIRMHPLIVPGILTLSRKVRERERRK
jgi:hypothetical protein